MPWIGAAIAAGGSLLGGILSSNAQSDAADASNAGTQAAIAEQRRQFDITTGRQQPWLTTGTSALNRIAQIYGLDTFVPAQGGAQGTAQIPLPSVTGQGYQSGFWTAPSPGQGDYAAIPAGTFVPGSGLQTPDFTSFYASPDYQYRLAQSLKGLEARAATGVFGGLDSGALRKAEIERAGDLASGEFNNYVNRLSALSGTGQTTSQNLSSLGQNYAANVGNALQNAADTRASAYANQGKTWADTISRIGAYGAGAFQNQNYGSSVPYGTPGSWSDYGYAF